MFEEMPEEDIEPLNHIEDLISQWRMYLLSHQENHNLDMDELESHLRDQMASFQRSGLDVEESFLISIKRLGNQEALSRAFFNEQSDRIWKQLFFSSETNGTKLAGLPFEIFMVFGLAFASALAFKVPELFGYHFQGSSTVFYLRNFSLFVLPFLAVYFVWKRQNIKDSIIWLVPPFLTAIVVANVYPFQPNSYTEGLTIIHLPVALWLLIGIAYAGGKWNTVSRRMDFVRFSGELFIYYTLIALGGGVFTGITIAMFSFIGLKAEAFAQSWIIPCGALGAVIVGSWLVETKNSMIESMVPLLTKIFTPLFTVMLLMFLAAMIWTNKGIQVEREVLIAFNLLLVLVLGLLLYAISARDTHAQFGLFDAAQLVLIMSALIIDMLALSAISWRISEFGFSPNRIASLGMNLILLVNLTWSAWLYFCFMRRRGGFASLERWQTDYLPVYAIWAWFVVVCFPPIFGFK